MANICSNQLYCSTDNNRNIDKVLYYLKDRFHITKLNNEDNRMHCTFESKWTFPKEEFDALMTEQGHDPTLFIEVVSFEPGMGYLEAHIFQEGVWSTIP